ncbi:plasmid partitioning protein RepB [Tianweitania sediminis]|uniref:Plasmid partitioning protein RepB n=1 Tax=Tianweitania sediminis TaxID=1502156 RepID=A0A8J7UL63_9HYPH|nr:plasmid partitioning protein RepB [Tianweitania sediminis]MBP0440399.1 plasmid partitioning protein RepB [Tianweitania sediminis]
MTKRPSKSITAAFGLANTVPLRPDEQRATEGKESPLPAPIGQRSMLTPGVIQASQKSISDLRQERDRLKALVEQGGTGQDLDPDLIDPSPFRDRLPDDDGQEFQAFKEEFVSEGQKLPILVRVDPENPERYQTAFGHRRTRAAREAGIRVRAVVAELSDRDLAIAQGVENDGRRQRLSWIERARFAADMEAKGLKARDIRAALSVDDPELTRFRAVIGALSMEVVEKIGRAPKAGRPKWVSLGKLVADSPEAGRVVDETLAVAKVSSLSSDERLDSLIKALRLPGTSRRTDHDLDDGKGNRIGTAVFGQGTIKLSLAPKCHDFSEFLKDEMPDLIERYFSQRRAE